MVHSCSALYGTPRLSSCPQLQTPKQNGASGWRRLSAATVGTRNPRAGALPRVGAWWSGRFASEHLGIVELLHIVADEHLGFRRRREVALDLGQSDFRAHRIDNRMQALV